MRRADFRREVKIMDYASYLKLDQVLGAQALESAKRGSAAHDEMLRQELRAIRERCRCMPIFDRRSPDEMIGYDERGLPR